MSAWELQEKRVLGKPAGLMPVRAGSGMAWHKGLTWQRRLGSYAQGLRQRYSGATVPDCHRLLCEQVRAILLPLPAAIAARHGCWRGFLRGMPTAGLRHRAGTLSFTMASCL